MVTFVALFWDDAVIILDVIFKGSINNKNLLLVGYFLPLIVSCPGLKIILNFITSLRNTFKNIFIWKMSPVPFKDIRAPKNPYNFGSAQGLYIYNMFLLTWIFVVFSLYKILIWWVVLFSPWKISPLLKDHKLFAPSCIFLVLHIICIKLII